MTPPFGGAGETVIRHAAPDDLVAVKGLLDQCELPTEGVKDHITEFLIAETDGETVGVIGLEQYADSGLLRSAAIIPERRGQGLGQTLVERILGEAAARGVETVYLLTTTAEQYFRQFGFEKVSRLQVPALVKRSAEFQGACPASAIAMSLSLWEDE